jgi:hypothetical protein
MRSLKASAVNEAGDDCDADPGAGGHSAMECERRIAVWACDAKWFKHLCSLPPARARRCGGLRDER